MAWEINMEVTGSDFSDRSRDDIRYFVRCLLCVGSCAMVENERMEWHCGDAGEERRHVNWRIASLAHVHLVRILKVVVMHHRLRKNERRNPHSKHDKRIKNGFSEL